ncbi:MFS transporter [Nocardia miyunensis]|uniref:MFS transporter n=1 Tax=Nocardia miyunensis TaxID=282684 RepID=UPI001FE0E234|nr:MFS transporter [Nocardia miyunensis]
MCVSTVAAPQQARLTRLLVLVFAVTAGSSAGCLYYLQPLLQQVGSDLRISTATAALLVSGAQVGYLCGLALLVPLGDFLERRRMVPGLLIASVVALVVSAVAPNFPILLAAVFVTGITASAAQVVVPWSSSLAEPGRRGQVVGTVMSGLLLGILSSRVLSGAIAQLGGWRAVLVVAAAIQLVMSVSVYLLTPATGRAASGERYREVLVSILSLIRLHPMLRHRMVLGFLAMACFSGVWTALAFLLAGDHGSPYHYSEVVIGLFGIAGVAGALGAPVVGRLSDRGYLRPVTTLVWVVLLASWALLAWGGHSIIALIVALLVFDFGIQGIQLSNQSAIYALDPAARSRLTTAYMVMYFLGGVAGSVTAGAAYESGGWARVCEIGVGATVVGIALWAVFARHIPARATTADTPD